MTDKCDICGKFLSKDWRSEDQEWICAKCVPIANAECEAQQ